MPTDEAWSHYVDAERPNVIATSMVAQMPAFSTQSSQELAQQKTEVTALLADYYRLIGGAYYLHTPSEGFIAHYALIAYIDSKPFPGLTAPETQSLLVNLKKEYTGKTCAHDTQTTS
jgi:hypothetical protein